LSADWPGRSLGKDAWYSPPRRCLLLLYGKNGGIRGGKNLRFLNLEKRNNFSGAKKDLEVTKYLRKVEKRGDVFEVSCRVPCQNKLEGPIKNKEFIRRTWGGGLGKGKTISGRFLETFTMPNRRESPKERFEGGD